MDGHGLYAIRDFKADETITIFTGQGFLWRLCHQRKRQPLGSTSTGKVLMMCAHDGTVLMMCAHDGTFQTNLLLGPAFKDDQGELMANVQGTMKRRAECIKARWLLPFFCAPCQFSAPCSVAPFAELCSVGTCPLVISWPM